jgi:hypothetical protein
MMCYLAASAPAVLGFEGLGLFLSEDSAPYYSSVSLYLNMLENVVGSAPTYTLLSFSRHAFDELEQYTLSHVMPRLQTSITFPKTFCVQPRLSQGRLRGRDVAISRVGRQESLACTLPSDTRWEEYDRNGEIIGLDEQTEQTLFKSGEKKNV